VKRLLYVVPILLAFWLLDNALSLDRYAGWERNSVRNSTRRWANRSKAQVAIMGSSTSKDWMSEAWLAQQLGLKNGDVLDAHINGCHFGCTWAEVRKFLQRKRHFKQVFLGTNLFQVCEYVHSKRVLQQQMMTPSLDIPKLFGIYLEAEQPLKYMGRFIGIRISGAYGDTKIIQEQAGRKLFGRGKRGQAWRWVRPQRAKQAGTPTHRCDYSEDKIALKRRFTESLLDDLARLSDHTYLMMLPERALSDPEEEYLASWEKHRALLHSLAEEREHVTLIDLVEGGVRGRRMFRDAIHLTKKGMGHQRSLFVKRLKEQGLWKGKPKKKKKEVKRR